MTLPFSSSCIKVELGFEVHLLEAPGLRRVLVCVHVSQQ